MRKAMAEAEAMRKKAEAEEATRKKAFDERKKKMADIKAESSTAGFKLLKVPVSGGYYLGMRQREYDSLLNLAPFSVTTEIRRYDLMAVPHYYKERLYMLVLSLPSLPDSIFSSGLADISSFYKKKLGEPDEEMVSDSVRVFPAAEDSSLTGEYRVKEATIKWHYNYHDITILYRFIEMKNGSWKGFCDIRYSGTMEFVRNLVKLAEKE